MNTTMWPHDVANAQINTFFQSLGFRSRPILVRTADEYHVLVRKTTISREDVGTQHASCIGRVRYRKLEEDDGDHAFHHFRFTNDIPEMRHVVDVRQRRRYQDVPYFFRQNWMDSGVQPFRGFRIWMTASWLPASIHGVQFLC